MMAKKGVSFRDMGRYPADKGCGGLCVKSTECPYPICVLDAGGWNALAHPVPTRRDVGAPAKAGWHEQEGLGKTASQKRTDT